MFLATTHGLEGLFREIISLVLPDHKSARAAEGVVIAVGSGHKLPRATCITHVRVTFVTGDF